MIVYIEYVHIQKLGHCECKGLEGKPFTITSQWPPLTSKDILNIKGSITH